MVCVIPLGTTGYKIRSGGLLLVEHGTLSIQGPSLARKYQRFGKQTRIIDGEMISWHGSTTPAGLRYLLEFFKNHA